jgi:hypothetical protein
MRHSPASLTGTAPDRPRLRPVPPGDGGRVTAMRRKGVLYDVGRVMGGNWRPDYSPAVVRREPSSQQMRHVNLEFLRSGAHHKPLNAFLARAVQAARGVFGGPVTFASRRSSTSTGSWSTSSARPLLVRARQGLLPQDARAAAGLRQASGDQRARVPDPDRGRPGRRRPGELPRPEHVAAHGARHPAVRPAPGQVRARA